jgi:hypothetical protein
MSAAGDDLDAATRCGSFAIRASPPLGAALTALLVRLGEVKRGSAERGRSELTVDAYVSGMRIGFYMGWPGADDGARNILRTRLRASPDDWALRILCADDLGDNQILTEEACREIVELVKPLREDRRVPLAARAYALHFAGFAEVLLHEFEAAEKDLEDAHRDHPCPEWPGSKLIVAYIEHWRSGRRAERALLDAAVATARRTVEDAKRRAAGSPGEQPAISPSGVPLALPDPEEDLVARAVHFAVEPLVCAGDFEAARGLLVHATDHDPDRAYDDAKLAVFVGFAAGESPSLDAVLAFPTPRNGHAKELQAQADRLRADGLADAADRLEAAIAARR